MKHYKYTDIHGKHGLIEAPSKSIAKMLCLEESIFIKRIKPYKFKLTLKTQISFFEELSTLLKAGISLFDSLVVMQQSHWPLTPIINPLIKVLNQGGSLSDFCKQQSFDNSCCQLINIGEQTGRIDTLLTQCALLLKKRKLMQDNIKKSLFYPGFIIIISLILTTGLLLFVVPQFESFFQSLNSELPLLTRIVIQCSEGLKNSFLTILISISIITLLFLKLKSKLKPLTLKLPLIGSIIKNNTWAITLTELSHYLSAGIPLQQTLNHMQQHQDQTQFKKLLQDWQQNLEQGKPLSAAMLAPTPEKVRLRTQIAEKSGQLEELFAELAQYFEQQAANSTEKLMQLIEPSIMVVLGIILGTLMIAMYLPIFYLGNAF